MFWTVVTSTVCAQSLEQVDDKSSSFVHNKSPFGLEGLLYGGQRLPPLRPNARIELPDDGSQLRGGRFQLGDWQIALDQRASTYAHYHLITAGVLPDIAEPGKAGDPESSANVAALLNYDGEIFTCPSSNDTECFGLLAHAARYLPVGQLEELLRRIPPNFRQASYAREYDQLTPIVDALRYAFENRSVQELSKVRIPQNWWRDRGVIHPVQFQVLNLGLPSGLTSIRPARSLLESVDAIYDAYRNGDELEAAHGALDAWRLNPSNHRLEPQVVRSICSGLDAGAALSNAAGHFISSYSYLILISEFCPDTDSQRERFADWFSIQGRSAFSTLRLSQARVLFERAHFFDKSAKTKAELADTLAELAILRFREGDLLEARAHLKVASRLAAFRPKVLAAHDADPGGNKRARIGILIVICFLAFFAIRKLRRVWFGDLTKSR